MRKPDYAIRSRLIEELTRLFPDHITMAHTLGLQVRQARDWWYQNCTPSASNFAMLDKHGVNIYYVITGQVKPDV